MRARPALAAMTAFAALASAGAAVAQSASAAGEPLTTALDICLTPPETGREIGPALTAAGWSEVTSQDADAAAAAGGHLGAAMLVTLGANTSGDSPQAAWKRISDTAAGAGGDAGLAPEIEAGKRVYTALDGDLAVLMAYGEAASGRLECRITGLRSADGLDAWLDAKGAADAKATSPLVRREAMVETDAGQLQARIVDRAFLEAQVPDEAAPGAFMAVSAVLWDGGGN